jgi:hypothetical protein
MVSQPVPLLDTQREEEERDEQDYLSRTIPLWIAR